MNTPYIRYSLGLMSKEEQDDYRLCEGLYSFSSNRKILNSNKDRVKEIFATPKKSEDKSVNLMKYLVYYIDNELSKNKIEYEHEYYNEKKKKKKRKITANQTIDFPLIFPPHFEFLEVKGDNINVLEHKLNKFLSDKEVRDRFDLISKEFQTDTLVGTSIDFRNQLLCSHGEFLHEYFHKYFGEIKCHFEVLNGKRRCKDKTITPNYEIPNGSVFGIYKLTPIKLYKNMFISMYDIVKNDYRDNHRVDSYYYSRRRGFLEETDEYQQNYVRFHLYYTTLISWSSNRVIKTSEYQIHPSFKLLGTFKYNDTFDKNLLDEIHKNYKSVSEYGRQGE